MKPHFLYGTHAALAALANPMRKIRRVLMTKNAQAELQKKLSGVKNLSIADGKNLESMLPPGSVHQGIAVECEPLAQPSLQEWLNLPLPNPPPQAGEGTRPSSLSPKGGGLGRGPILLLDQITDPHNVGAILRSAAAFDVGAVIVTDKNAPRESGVMAKAASGAMEIVPLITVINLAQAMDLIKKSGYWIAGLDGNAKQPIHEAKLDAKTALVLGAEGEGLRRLTAENCDFLVRLPMSNRIESLNVSNAAAVALYAIYSRMLQ